MLSALKKHGTRVAAVLWSLCNALFWLALRVNWAGISKFLGADKNPSFLVMESPLLVCILMFLLLAGELAELLFLPAKRCRTALSFALNALMSIAIGAVIAFGAIDYLSFILPKFLRSLLVCAGLIAVALLLFFPPASQTKRAKAGKAAVLAALLIAAVFLGYGIIPDNRFTYEPVVYAVEDTYQIVFSTADQSIASAEIDGVRYYDLYAGSMRSKARVHKVTVPQSALDAAKAYTVCAQKMIYRGPFGGYKGREIAKTYHFRPVDSSDGLVYYAMTDVHSAADGAIRTASYCTDMDFLVMLGDCVSMVESEADAQFANRLAHAVTRGEFPVVYARGNHEVKGAYAEDLYRYVGSLDQAFYYEFTLSDVYGVVLDLGEDHDDDWWEYYGTARFDSYRDAQTELLTRAADDGHADGYAYTLAVCHIPIPYVNYRHNHESAKAAWTAQLNRLQPDLVLAGHQHDLYPFLEGTIEMTPAHELAYNPAFRSGTYGGYVTDFRFNAFITGRRGTSQTDEVSPLNRRDHIGLVTRVDLSSGEQVSTYLNSAGQTVPVFNPFVEGEAQTSFVTRLK